jgi:tRNA-specific 2-thiouridylase
MPRSAMIAMSGGVDSSVAALLALRSGFDCAGAVIELHPCAADCKTDARATAEKLNIPLYEFDFSQRFATCVIEPFIDAYREGRTPNPCVDCNKHIKFGALLEKANELGKDCIVTGHYAQIEQSGNGRFLLKKGVHLSKDQSYVLYSLTQDQLARTMFPLGGLTKPQVRELALSEGFENADRSESQDICFVPDGDYAKFIAEYTGTRHQKGRFVDINGNYLGDHSGVACYTVGQRRGMGLAMPYPAYVLELRPESSTVVVGREDMLYSRTLYAKDINFIPFDKLDAPLKAQVKIRYRHAGQPAIVRQIDENTLCAKFDEPQRAITKGQAAVVYDGDIVIGGGTIISLAER